MNFRCCVALSLFALFTTADAADLPPAPVLEDRWNFTLGMGMASGSKYPGSDEQKTLVMPMFGATYGRFFLGMAPGVNAPLGAGMFVLQDAHWSVGTGLSLPFMKARKESDSVHLRGLGDIDGSLLGSVFASYHVRWFAINTSAITDLGGHDQGTRLSVGFDFTVPLTSQWLLVAGPGVTWADSTYTRTFFGVTPAQSASSGLREYTPDGGIHSLRVAAGLNYFATPKWNLGANVSLNQLRGDAADSPITLQKTQTQFALFASYRF